MVIGPFQPTVEELVEAERLGIDHSKMTCSGLRVRLASKRSKSSPEIELRETVIKRLQQLDQPVNRQQTTSALLQQLRNHLEYLLTRNGVIEDATLVIAEAAPKEFLPAGAFKIKSVGCRQSNRLRVFTAHDREFDAYEVLRVLNQSVTVQ